MSNKVTRWSPDLVEASSRVQLALDGGELGDALELVSILGGLATRIEAGTPLILKYGIDAVASLRAQAPDAYLIADVKICDAGLRIANNAFAAGANAVTVVGAVCDATTRTGTLEAAAATRRGSVIVDTIGMSTDDGQIAKWSKEASDIGVPLEVCVHRDKGSAQRAFDLLAPWRESFPKSNQRTLAGGLDLALARDAFGAGFGTVIVGKALAVASRPQETWQKFVELALSRIQAEERSRTARG